MANVAAIAKANELIGVGPEPTNGGKAMIEFTLPYMAEVRLEGVCDIMFHRWNVEGVETKARAAKGSKAKKTDDLESYVYRDEAGDLCIPGNYLVQSMIYAAKFKEDPRSPRKSAMDLYKAGVVSLTPLASLGLKAWHYEDRRRVMIQRNGVTRVRPALRKGWTVTMQLLVNLPEYIPPDALQEIIVNAGRLIGLADNRPTYGRFNVTRFEVVALS